MPREACPICDGEGVIEYVDDETPSLFCIACNGTGDARVEPLDPRDPPIEKTESEEPK